MAELGSSADDGRQFGGTAALTVAERQYTTHNCRSRCLGFNGG
jgi:hypothetical protein